MIWQTDAFALATGYDEAAGRYIGLWTPDDKGAAPAATDSLLLVRPDVAAKQRAAEPARSARRADANEPIRRRQPSTSSPTQSTAGVRHRKLKTRFFGVKTLNSDKIALDFKNIADEILANLRERRHRAGR